MTQPDYQLAWNLVLEDRLRDYDPICRYRGCNHNFSMHDKTWKGSDGKRKRCRCKHKAVLK